MTVTRLILLRHGQPAHEVLGRCCGRLDPPLSAMGRRQIQAARDWIAHCGRIDVYCSPLRRAVESARLLTGRRPIRSDDRLREIDFGAVDGLTFAEIERRYPVLFRTWMTCPTAVTFPGGEPFDAMACRVRSAVADLRRRCAGRTIAVVAHGGVNRLILADALGLPLTSMFRLAQDYGCINLVEYVGDAPVVRGVNLRPGAPC